MAQIFTDTAETPLPVGVRSPRKRPLPHACGHCGARWDGFNTAHCAAKGCCQTFTGISAFELHRTGSHSDTGERIIDKATGQPKGPRRCLPPADVGLVDAGRGYPCWGYPSDGTDFWAAR